MKEVPNYPPIDPELEARIVALVLGEASDFERDELNRLIEDRPELAAFKEEIQSVHGLLSDVGAGELVAENDEWKLSGEKRTALLAAISGEVNEQPALQLVSKSTDQRRSRLSSFLRNITKIAAVLCVAGFIGSMMVPPQLARRQADSSQAHDSRSESLMGDASAPAAKVVITDGAVTMTTDDEYSQSANATTIAEPDYRDNSKSALSSIRKSLGADTTLPSPYYRMDDVQSSLSGPDSKLSREASAVTPAPPAVAGPAVGSRPAARSTAVASGGLPAVDNARLESGGELFSRVQAERSADEGRLRAEVRGQLRAARPDPPQPSSDDLALIPQGVKRSGTTTSNGAFTWQDANSFYYERGDGESNDGRATDDASRQIPRLRMSDRRLVEGEPDDSPEPTTAGLSDQEAGQGQSNREADTIISGFHSRTGRITLGGVLHSDAAVTEAKRSAGQSAPGLAEGTTLRFPTDLAAESSTAGKQIEDLNRVDDEQDKELGEEGFRLEGIASADASQNTWSTKLNRQEFERLWGESSSVSEPQETAPAPVLSKPVVIGRGGSIGGGGGDEADKAPNHAMLGKGTGSHTMSGGTGKPMSSTKDLKKSEVAKGFKEDFAMDGISLPRDGNIVLNESWMANGGESSGPQKPVSGTAIGQPFGELQAGQANRNGRWSYDAQPETLQSGPVGLNKLGSIVVLDADGDGVEMDFERTPSKLKSKRRGLGLQPDEPAVDVQNGRYRYVLPKTTRAPITKLAASAGLNEKTAAEEAFSTFSLHVSDVSFKLARAALAQGSWPEPSKVRIEEFVNAFDYGDPMPSQSEKVACRVEQSIHPFLQQRNVLRVAMRTAAAGRSSNTPLRLTFLLDNSGSMERIDRQQTVRRAFALLAGQLKPIDQVTLISFARQPRLLADKVSGAQSRQLVGLVENLPSEGGTNIEAALQLAFEKAREQHLDDAQNRIILLTDGAVNLGDADPESLSRMITTMRDAGIAFDAAGISAEGLNDEILEALTRKGDGRYYLLDSVEAADDGFARQIAGALRPSAKNVKVQIEFNPKRVGRYKLLGFEKHRLKKEDFRNDKVDAAEMAAAEAGVAVYQFEAKPDGEGDVGSVSVRFRDLSTGQMVENCWPIPYETDAPRLDQAAPALRIATSAALLAAKLRGEALGETVDLKTLSNLIAGLPEQERKAKRIGELQQMIEQARQVSGK